MKRLKGVGVLVIISLCLVATAFATQTAVNLTAEANTKWCSEPYNVPINCSTLPTGSKTYDGVKFKIPTTNNAWFADVAAGGSSGDVSVTIPVNVKNVVTVYTLMNTLWASSTAHLLSITFTGSDGATWTYYLVSGSDIRDYNNGNYLNSIDCSIPGRRLRRLAKWGPLRPGTTVARASGWTCRYLRCRSPLPHKR